MDKNLFIFTNPDQPYDNISQGVVEGIFSSD